jgi:hypothetical protein
VKTAHSFANAKPASSRPAFACALLMSTTDGSGNAWREQRLALDYSASPGQERD